MQFDVHPNPVARDRRTWPFVAVLQSIASQSGSDRIVAPLIRMGATPSMGRATPIVRVDDEQFLLHMPGLVGLPARMLKKPVGSIAAHRDRIVEALDWLFLGI
jgi:toxin CcdB